MTLKEIGETGDLPAGVESDDLLRSVAAAAAGVYRRYGFVRPWGGYLACEGGTPVGTCAFKTPPQDSRVEIAYFTFPGHEGRGVGMAMAA